uniref:Uncharacterized protein MANES_06G019300 n=1 Tax=Rhizophora mucronata TaxID=61149 RepID=A0A2P2IW03_RHIMU
MPGPTVGRRFPMMFWGQKEVMSLYVSRLSPGNELWVAILNVADTWKNSFVI